MLKSPHKNNHIIILFGYKLVNNKEKDILQSKYTISMLTSQKNDISKCEGFARKQKGRVRQMVD
jgi:hypothetical protein